MSSEPGAAEEEAPLAEAAATGARPDAGETPMNLSVERAARMLGLFNLDTPELTLSEITEALGTSRATTHRYALALRRTGLLRYNPDTLRYTVGPRILELASVAVASLPVLDIAEPHMAQLSSRLDQTLVLSIWDGDGPLIVRVVDRTNRIVSINVRTGGRMNRHASAHGRAFVAFDPLIDVDETKLPAGVLDRVRETHVAVYTSESAGFRAVAVPIFHDGKVTATLGVVGLINFVPVEEDSDLAKALKRTAGIISRELDGAPPSDDAR